MPVSANYLTTMRKLSYLAMVIIPLLCISLYTVAGGSFGFTHLFGDSNSIFHRLKTVQKSRIISDAGWMFLASSVRLFSLLVNLKLHDQNLLSIFLLGQNVRECYFCPLKGNKKLLHTYYKLYGYCSLSLHKF